jgi:hypothetical protein
MRWLGKCKPAKTQSTRKRKEEASPKGGWKDRGGGVLMAVLDLVCSVTKV